MSAEDAIIEEAVDYEADEQPTTAAEEAVEEMAAAGEEPAAENVTAEAAQKISDATQAEASTKGANGSLLPKAAGDPSDPMSLPPQGTEVFIGGIPKTATEAQVKEFCEQVGEVHSIKLSKDPSNAEQHRGFGFARYYAKDCAEAAKEKLHETEMKGFTAKIRVSNTQAKHKLYLGNIPKSWTKEQVSDELNKTVKGMEGFDLVMSKEIPNQNRGYAFLVFYNHECAAAAKDILGKPSFSLDGRQMTVSYAEPKVTPEQSNSASKPSKAIYIGGLPPGATEENLKELFNKHGEVAKVVIPPATEKRPERQFGFVHFTEQAAADKAVAEAAGADKPELLGKALEVKAARPQEQKMGQMGGQEYVLGGSGRGLGSRGGRMPGNSLPAPRGRGRGGRMPYSRMPAQNPGYDQIYDQGYGMYDQGPGTYAQSYADASTAYGGYAGMAPVAAASPAAGMTMVPMMLPTGQVGYVLQSVNSGALAADYGSYAAPGPERSHGQAFRGNSRGRGSSRYRPY